MEIMKFDGKPKVLINLDPESLEFAKKVTIERSSIAVLATEMEKCVTSYDLAKFFINMADTLLNTADADRVRFGENTDVTQ